VISLFLDSDYYFKEASIIKTTSAYMKNLAIVFVIFSHFCFSQEKKHSVNDKFHFICIQSSNVYHNNANCASLMMCSGGKTRKTKNIKGLKPCMKCVRPQSKSALPSPVISDGFSDIKKVLGVKDKKQIADSLGTTEGTIDRPGNLTIRISGPPDSRTVNTIEFYFKKPIEFNEDTLFSTRFYNRLGLQFGGCKADTIRNTTPHPVTGKIKKDVSIEYRGCAIVEARDNYEDTSKYFYELIFVANEKDLYSFLDKVQLVLRVNRP